MDATVLVEEVEEIASRSGNTRYIVRDAEGNEYTTFRPQIGGEAARYQGRRAHITYHFRRDSHPSVTQMSILEQTLPPSMLPEYVNILLEKVWQDKSPSIPMLRRIQRVSQQLPG
jgi:hypothetical protein